MVISWILLPYLIVCILPLSISVVSFIVACSRWVVRWDATSSFVYNGVSVYWRAWCHRYRHITVALFNMLVRRSPSSEIWTKCCARTCEHCAICTDILWWMCFKWSRVAFRSCDIWTGMRAYPRACATGTDILLWPSSAYQRIQVAFETACVRTREHVP